MSLRLGLVLASLPFHTAPVVHRLLVLPNASVVHVRFLRCSAELAGLHPRQHLRPPEINRPPAPERLAPSGDEEQLVGTRILYQFLGLDERPPDLMYVEVSALRPGAMGKPHAPLAAAALAFGVGQHATLTAKR